METSQVEAAVRLAAAGMGPALVPENIVPTELRGNAFRVDPPIGRYVTLYARSHWGPLGSAFLEIAREAKWDEPPRGAMTIA